LYVNDTNDVLLNRFTVVYDDASVFNTHTEISYQKTEKIKFLFISDFFQYNLNEEDYAWQRPSLDARLSVFYNLKSKIVVKCEIIAISDRDVKTFGKTTPSVQLKSLPGTMDMNLGIEYRYSKIFSAFLNFNNIGAKQYLWYKYPYYHFMVIGGISYAF
jgi:hypothetical protein